MLQCPHCHMALREHFENDVEIDICDSCHGVWLDQGELEIISNGKDFDPHADAIEGLPDLRCPRCDIQTFTTIQMEEGRLAQCSDCHGLFVEAETLARVASVKSRPVPRERSGISTSDKVMYADLLVWLLWG